MFDDLPLEPTRYSTPLLDRFRNWHHLVLVITQIRHGLETGHCPSKSKDRSNTEWNGTAGQFFEKMIDSNTEWNGTVTTMHKIQLFVFRWFYQLLYFRAACNKASERSMTLGVPQNFMANDGSNTLRLQVYHVLTICHFLFILMKIQFLKTAT